MATEYISREAMHRANRCEWDGVCGDYDGHQIFIDNENMIDSIPVADVRPVIRGKWEWNEHYGLYECSNCHNSFVDEEWVKEGKWQYCPSCGADMKKIIKLTLEHEV